MTDMFSRAMGELGKLAGAGLADALTDPEQPVGEIPDIYPSVARAYKSVDDVAAELRGVKAAHAELQRENVALAAKLEDARAEVGNLTDHIKKSGRVSSALSTMLAAYQDERDELRDQLEEFDDYRELQVRVQELETELEAQFTRCDKAESKLMAARAERDTAKAKASVQR